MSTTVDQRVVEMQFNNSQFESNVKTSLNTIEKLKQSLDMTGASKGFENINSAVENVNMSGLSSAIETVNTRFSALQVIGVTALANITNSAINAGKQLLSSLTVDNIADGWEKFANKTQSVGTLLAQGYDLSTVTDQLERLNWYTDETSYNFTDMVSNISKFTASGQELNTSVTAMEGIANWAALSGQNASTASRAMYQLAQAMSAGYMRLEDYKSIQNASMDTEEFRQKCLDAAVALGTLKDNSDGTYTSIVDGATSTTFSLSQFTTGLTKGAWLTSDVMMEVFNDYSGAVDQIYEYAEEKGITASEAIAELGDSVDAFGLKAFKAAQEARTWSDVIDSVKDALGTAFMNTFELIFGNYEEATALWTSLANTLYDIFVEPVNSLNELLEGALGNPFEGLVSRIESVTGATETMSSVMQDYGDIVDQVIQGSYGNGQSRWDALTEAGYDWAYVQNLVNEKLGDSTRHATEFSEAQEELNQTQKITIEDLTKMSDAQLKNLDFTDDEIKAFRQLAEQSEKTGIPIADLAADLDQLNGRTLLLNGFANIGNSLINIFSAIGVAWRNVFPATTSEQLYNLIAAFHKFTTYLEINDETANKITKTFQGLFSILGIIKTVVGSTLNVAFDVFRSTLGTCNISILDITANVGDAIWNFHQWLMENDKLTNAIQTVGNTLVSGVKKIKEFIEAFLKLQAVQSTIESLKNKLSELKEIGINALEGLKNGFLDGAISIPQILTEIGNSILSAIKTVLGIHSPSTEMYDVAINAVEGLKNGFKDGTSGIREVITRIGNTIIETFTKIDWSKIYAGGVSVALLLLVKRLSDAFDAISAPAKGIGEVLSGLGEIFSKSAKGIGKMTKNIAKVIKSFANVLNSYAFSLKTDALKDIAIALGILVASVVVLTQLDINKVQNAVLVIVELAAVLAVLALAMSKIGGSSASISKSGIQIDSSVPKLLGIATSLLALAAVVKIMGSMDSNQMKQGFLGLAGGITALVSVVAAYGLLVKADASGNISKVGSMMLKLSAALLLMVAVVKLVGMLSTEEMLKGLAFVSAFTAFVAAIVAITIIGSDQQIAKISGLLLAISASLLLMVGVVKLAGGLSTDEMIKGAAFVAAFTVFLAALVAITTVSSETQIAKISGLLLAVSASMLLLVAVVKLVGFLTVEDMVKGVAFVAAFTVFLAAVVAITTIASDQQIAKVSLTILSLSVALSILAGVAVLLSLISISGLAKGIVAVGMLGAIMSLMIVATKNANDCKATIIAIAAAIAVLAVAVAALSFIEPSRLAGATAALSILMGMFALIVNASGSVTMSMGTLVVMVAAIALLAAIVYAIAELPVESSLAASASLSVLLLALAASMKIISGVTTVSASALITIGVMTLVVAALAAILYLLQDLPVESTLAVAISLSTLLLALSSACLILSAVGATGAAAYIGVGALITLITSVGLLMASIGALCTYFPQLEEFLNKGLTILEEIGYGIGSFVGNIVGGFLSGVTSGLPEIGENLSGFMENAQPFFDGIQKVDTESINGVKALAETILILTAADVLNGLTSWFTGGLSIVDFGKQIAEFGPYFNDYYESIKNVDGSVVEASANAAKALAEFASEIPNSGGILASLAGDNSLTSFAEELVVIGPLYSSYADSVSGLDSEVVENSANAAKALAEMANNLPDRGGIISWFTGNSSLSVFGEELVVFGPLLASYADSVSGLDSEVVKNSSDAALALAGMAESLPNQGGMLSWFVGDNTLSAFAKELAEFGPLLSNYANSISGVNADVVTRSANAALALAELADNLPNNGGVASWFAGDNDISKFGEKLSSFGVSFAAYYSSVSTVNTSKLSSVTAELEKLVDVATGISSVDTSAMSNFSQSLTKLGNSGIDSFINAFDGSHSKVIKSITDLINACISGINSQYKLFYNAGVNMMKGFATGIQSTSGEVTNTATGVVLTAVNAIKNVLDINSPSKVTNEIGKNTGEGFINGLNETADDAEEAGENLGEAAYSGLLDSVEEGSEQLNSELADANDEAVKETKNYWNKLIEIAENGLDEDGNLNESWIASRNTTNNETASMNDESIAEENRYWEELLAVKNDGLQKEKESSLTMTEFRKEIVTQTISILKEYTDALQSNTDSLMNNSGIFSEVSEQEAVSADTLTKNLEDQIEQLEEYGTVMASLNSRIADGGLKDAINQMGVDSLAELQALNGMTDEELNNYVSLYDQKYALCQQVAAQQLSGLQTETETKLSQLYGGAEVNLQQFAQSFDGTFESIRGYVGESIAVGSQLASGVAEGITAGTEESKQAAIKMITDTEEAAKQAADINSPSGLFRDNVGKNITAGIAEGMVADEAKSEIQASVEEINQFTLESFTESSDTFVEAGVGIIESYREGISNSTGELKAQCEESMTVALTQMQAVITNSQPAFQTEAENIITSFISGVQSKSSETIATITDLTSNMLEAIQSRYGEFNSVGINCMTKFITGIKSKQTEAKSTMTTIVTNVLTVIKNKYSQFNSVGTGCMEQFISGIQSKESKTISTCKKIVSSCISTLEDKYDDFYDVGANLAEGFEEGILSKAREISRAAAEIAREAMEAVEDELDEHSPSKEMMKRGQYFSEGFAIGIEDETSSVTGVAKDMADSALSTVSDAIRTIAYIFDNGVDTEPTIRPVLDLSNVESGMSVLNTLFARNQVMAISDGMDVSRRLEIQNDGPDRSSGNTYQFTQNNYSPKALSRVEIYRQTKNQFSAMERMVEA